MASYASFAFPKNDDNRLTAAGLQKSFK